MADITYHADPNVISYIGEKVRKETYYLGLGTAIPAGADFNDYTTPGVYTSTGTYGFANYSNTPRDQIGSSVVTDSSFNLVVSELKHGNGSKGTLQIVYSFDSAIYIRSTSGGSWTNSVWRMPGGVDSIVAEGASGNWRYWKYANGYCICQYRANVWIPAISSGATNYTLVSLTLPFDLYYASGEVSCSADRVMRFETAVSGDDPKTALITVQRANGTAFTAANKWLVCTYMGYWK